MTVRSCIFYHTTQQYQIHTAIIYHHQLSYTNYKPKNHTIQQKIKKIHKYLKKLASCKIPIAKISELEICPVYLAAETKSNM